jgi:two-component system, chemotaxis family, response regulator Rcp1
MNVLLVEDNPGDARLVQEAVADFEPAVNLHVLGDGEAALGYLRQATGSAQGGDAPRPDLVILDWGLPGMSGAEVLRAMKEDAQLRRIPVVILTMTDDAVAMGDAYDLHANAFVAKPLDGSNLQDALRKTTHFWSSIAKLPPSR